MVSGFRRAVAAISPVLAPLGMSSSPSRARGLPSRHRSLPPRYENRQAAAVIHATRTNWLLRPFISVGYGGRLGLGGSGMIHGGLSITGLRRGLLISLAVLAAAPLAGCDSGPPAPAAGASTRPAPATASRSASP